MATLTDTARRICQAQTTKPVAALTISEFARSGRVVRIRSEVLGCDVILAADNADPAKAGAAGLPIYWARELRELIGVEPAHLRLIHETKSVFEGEVIP